MGMMWAALREPRLRQPAVRRLDWSERSEAHRPQRGHRGAARQGAPNDLVAPVTPSASRSIFSVGCTRPGRYAPCVQAGQSRAIHPGDAL